ncbi:MAG TPA: sugar porter family MFS transporter [Rhodanobacteraceae bacterium]|jgi:sugar porter (SP) family MFS transporter|nr:sugar porter family MFS transporter [Rhodanobacteraceae bacterium]
MIEQTTATRSTRMTGTTLAVIAFAGLGGILYGFDIGVISGALIFMQDSLSISANDASLIVAAVLGGGALATLLSGPFADRFGRRFAINVSAVVFIIGVLILVFSVNFATVMLGRLVQGIGIGIITIVIPLYMAETIPPKLRGRGIALFQLCLTFGILLGYVVNYGLKGTGDWRLMFATALVPSLVFLAGGLFLLPRSPRWLVQKGLVDEARDVLTRVQGAAEVEQAMAEMRAVVAEEGKVAGGSWSLLLRGGYRKAFLIALAVGILNQLSGVNVLLQFNATILGASGLHHTALLGSVGIGLVNFVVTIIAMSLVDKLGRKPLLTIGTAGVTVALLFIGVIHLFFPPSLFSGYATLAGFITFIIFFAVGPGVVVWLAISEILPLAIRAKGMAVALFANSLASAGLAAGFMLIVGAIGYSGMFFLLAFFVFLYLLIAIFALPETKGRSLEEIEKTHFAGIGVH